MRSPRVLFVCLGNICRSPLAEAAFRGAAERAGLEVEIDSAGTGEWHIGHPPDPRSVAVAARHGVDISGQRARQVRRDDFHHYDEIVALDPQNLLDLMAIAPKDGTARLSLLLDHVPGWAGRGVRDPYYDEDEAFEEVWREVTMAAEALAGELSR